MRHNGLGLQLRRPAADRPAEASVDPGTNTKRQLSGEIAAGTWDVSLKTEKKGSLKLEAPAEKLVYTWEQIQEWLGGNLK